MKSASFWQMKKTLPLQDPDRVSVRLKKGTLVCVRSIGKPEQVVGRNVEVSCDFGDIGSRRIAFVGFPIANDSQTYAQIPCYRRL